METLALTLPGVLAGNGRECIHCKAPLPLVAHSDVRRTDVTAFQTTAEHAPDCVWRMAFEFAAAAQ